MLAVWWFIKRSRQCMGDVQVTPSINIGSTDPTVAQCLNYIAKRALESPGCPSPSPPSFKSQFPHQTRSLLLPPDSCAPAVLLLADGTEQFFDDGDVIGLEDTVEGLHGSTSRAVVFGITIALKVVDLYKMQDGLAPIEIELACYQYMAKLNGKIVHRGKPASLPKQKSLILNDSLIHVHRRNCCPAPQRLQHAGERRFPGTWYQVD
jgi:hypothetical protein